MTSLQRTAGKEEYAPTPYSKGKGVKGKRDASPMANRHQPPYKTPKHDNPVASQRVPELARGKDGKAKIPVPPPRLASNLPQPPPADLTRGQAGIPPISEKPLMLFTRPEAIREYNLIQPKRLPTSGECLPFEDMKRILSKYIPDSSPRTTSTYRNTGIRPIHGNIPCPTSMPGNCAVR